MGLIPPYFIPYSTHSGAREDVPVRVPVIEIDDEAMQAEMRWQESLVDEDEEDIN